MNINLERTIGVWSEINGESGTDQSDFNIEAYRNQISDLSSIGPAVYYMFDYNVKDYIYISGDVKSVFSYDKSDLTVHKIFSKVHPEDQPFFAVKARMTMDFTNRNLPLNKAKDYKIVTDFRVKDMSGEWRRVLQQFKVIETTADNKLSVILGSYTDITFLKGVSYNDNTVSFLGLNGEPSYYNVKPDPYYVHQYVGVGSMMTGRELEILDYIAKGYTSKEIAEKLFIAEETVKKHRKNILEKSGKKNITELIADFIRKGLL
ncbi:LuxR C-terminal-related transcriptional regulator [Limibacter armeniacum]|uniref:LuxR C-terminal-related transcriptional regulator n=1 Tax=Limibacter armeniacum TaxID=466084 RepID=UPI002FE51537